MIPELCLSGRRGSAEQVSASMDESVHDKEETVAASSQWTWKCYALVSIDAEGAELAGQQGVDLSQAEIRRTC